MSEAKVPVYGLGRRRLWIVNVQPGAKVRPHRWPGKCLYASPIDVAVFVLSKVKRDEGEG